MEGRDRTCLAIRELFAVGRRVQSVQSGVYLNSEHTELKYARKKKDSHTFEADQASFKGSRVSPPLTHRAIISRFHPFHSYIFAGFGLRIPFLQLFHPDLIPNIYLSSMNRGLNT